MVTRCWRRFVLVLPLAGLFLLPWPSLPCHAQQDAKDAEIERLRKENLILQDFVKKLEQNLLHAAKEQAKIKSDLVGLESRAKILEQRNETLAQRIRELEKALAGKNANPPAQDNVSTPQSNPPSNKLEGLIEKVDPKDQSLVVISIGSDSGLAKGHTLEVYRLKPAPTYLGMIRIIDVSKGKAVARLMRPANVPNLPAPLVGDRVTSSLISSAEPKKN
jgi:hypothetical protein